VSDYYTAWVIVIGCLLNAFIMSYLMHLCEREYWLPQHANSGVLPIRYRDMKYPGEVTRGADGSDHGGNADLVMQYEGELYHQSPYVSLLNSFYFIGIVATTTGLGDIAPVTQQGKMFAVAAALMGT
jgi:hypothetical protein